MKKLNIILMALLAMIFATACRRASDNGDLDGLWRIDSIEYLTGENAPRTVYPEGKFIGVQLELLQLDAPKPKATAIISYKKGGSTLGLDFAQKPSLELLGEFGIMENPCVLEVAVLNSKHLVLKSPYSVITCTRF